MRACEQAKSVPGGRSTFEHDWAALCIKARPSEFLQLVRPVDGGYSEIKVKLEHPLEEHGHNGQYLDLLITAVAGDAIAERVNQAKEALKSYERQLAEALEQEALIVREPGMFYFRESESVKNHIKFIEDVIANPILGTTRDAFIVEIKPKREPINSTLRQFQHQQCRWNREERERDEALGYECRLYRRVHWILAAMYESSQAERRELREIGVEVLTLSRQRVYGHIEKNRAFYG